MRRKDSTDNTWEKFVFKLVLLDWDYMDIIFNFFVKFQQRYLDIEREQILQRLLRNGDLGKPGVFQF